MINVVNKHWHKPTIDDYYIGRGNSPGSIFGNPFSHKDGTTAQYRVATRDEAVDKYLPYLRELYKNDSRVRAELEKLARKHKTGSTINLVCWCAPARCHGDVLKDAIIKIAATL